MSPQAQLWHIYWVPACRHTRPDPKDKLAVIVCRDTNPMGFLINSRIHPWISSDPQRLACQAEITAAEHSCLIHDSYVDCLELYEFNDGELQNQRDPVSQAAQAEMKLAVAQSKTIIKRYKDLIANS